MKQKGYKTFWRLMLGVLVFLLIINGVNADNNTREDMAGKTMIMIPDSVLGIEVKACMHIVMIQNFTSRINTATTFTQHIFQTHNHFLSKKVLIVHSTIVCIL